MQRDGPIRLLPTHGLDVVAPVVNGLALLRARTEEPPDVAVFDGVPTIPAQPAAPARITLRFPPS